ncbi:SusC/RagA family TonB-linked outer membrane protein [Fodinibius salsisoli]|uniref:SusC/RagA family TonB-linked outer membrane protein n=1 Tax=Fodinibius salsisoli TaxID=2820877 RepID=A0ABT3PJ66_9BACT|nr:SusC/RagA family TonB-linked outer membrane protein [Fodinibius salsisoli]MCW9705975.1 SusC/RagA family TonB-linked outer membrane protein [Fodinibius salsisoli]
MFKKLLSTLCFILFFVPVLWAQSGSIEGTVTDEETGEVVPGANVLLVEPNRGAATNVEGRYAIKNIEPGTYTLRVTFVGYKTHSQQITITAGEMLEQDVALRSGALNLDEVVVTALGIERQARAVGYAVQEVDGASVSEAPEANLVNALAGKVAGVQINSSSGQPGASSRIIIRGNSSLLGNNQPLFVVDGIPISNEEDDNPAGNAVFTGGTSNRSLDIDPSIIKDISVLKGASATALYGSRAANGAVIITTKQGTVGQAPRIELKSSVGWADAITDGFQNEYTLGIEGFYSNGLPRERGGYTEPGYPGENPNPQTTRSWGPHKDEISQQVISDIGEVNIYDPREDFYQTGITAENALNLSGGTERGNYFFSASNLNQSGIVPETKLDRTSLTGKFGTQFGDDLNVQTSVTYTNTQNDWLAEGNGTQAYLFGLNFAPINFNIKDVQFEDGTQRMNSSAFNNPFWLSENNGFTSDVDRFIARTELKYDLLPWLSLTERIGIDTYSDKRKGKVNVGTRGTPNGSMFDQKINRSQVNSDLTLTASQDLNEDFSAELLVGNNINVRQYDYELVEGTNLNVPDFFHISNADVVTADEVVEEQRLYSVYGQATLDYRDYIYLTLTGRNDWSSTLPDDKNSYFYPSASLGFVFTDALDLFDNSFFTFGKLRMSLSQIGNDAPVYSLSTNFNQAAPGDGVRGVINYPFNGINGYTLSSSLGNPDLKPEISTEYEVGLDLRFFEGRANVDFSYYDRITRDQIFEVPVSSATGFESRLLNAGEIKNYGVEMSLGGRPIETNDFQWDLQFNFAKNTSEVVELAPGVENIFLGGFTNPQIRIEPTKGGYGVIWGTRYERNDEGQLIIGDNGLPIISGETGPIGNVQPDWTSNLRTTFRYKGVELSALFDKRQGGDILNFDLFYSVFYGTAGITGNRGSTYTYPGVNVNTGEPNDVEITRDQTYYQTHYTNSFENLVEDGGFIKLRELSLAYRLPNSLLAQTPFKSLTVKGIGRNLWIDSDFSYLDPEGSLLGAGNAQGFYHAVTPSSRSIVVSLNVSF